MGRRKGGGEAEAERQQVEKRKSVTTKKGVGTRSASRREESIESAEGRKKGTVGA